MPVPEIRVHSKEFIYTVACNAQELQNTEEFMEYIEVHIYQLT